jgi:predicted CXXCH cytochrome family protein
MVIAGGVSLWTGAQAQNKKAKPDKSSAAADSKSSQHPADPSQYAGTEACKTCHEEMWKSFERGPHWKTLLDTHKGPEWQGCESCHGPGKEHAESGELTKIVNLKLSREESSKRYLECNEFGEEHSNFLRSQHLKNDVGCIDCHSVHSSKVEMKLLKAAQLQVCF